MLPGFPLRRPPFRKDFLLSELPAVVIDFETTGLYPNRGDEIIELAAEYVEGFEIRTTQIFQQLVNPGRPVSKSAFDVHGIPDEVLATQPVIDGVLSEFISFLDDRIIVGHNIVFDLSFLVKALKRNKLPPLQNEIFDTRWLSRLIFPDAAQHSLDAVAGRLGIERPLDRHRALGDVLLTAEVFVRLSRICLEKGYRRIGDVIDAYEAVDRGQHGSDEVLEALSQGFVERRVLEIVYSKDIPESGGGLEKRSTRKVEVYYFSPPYFLGYCHSRRAVRTFRTDRVLKVRCLDAAYEIPEDFHPRDYFLRWGGSLGR